MDRNRRDHADAGYVGASRRVPLWLSFLTGSPAVRKLAWEWVRIKEAQKAGIELSPAATGLGLDPAVSRSHRVGVARLDQIKSGKCDATKKGPALILRRSNPMPAMSQMGPGCVKTKSDLVVTPSGG
jgi:hypothetical protein